LNEKDQKKQVPLRITHTLWTDLTAWADDEFRSLNGEMEFLLTESVKNRKNRLNRQGRADPLNGAGAMNGANALNGAGGAGVHSADAAEDIPRDIDGYNGGGEAGARGAPGVPD